MDLAQKFANSRSVYIILTLVNARAMVNLIVFELINLKKTVNIDEFLVRTFRIYMKDIVLQIKLNLFVGTRVVQNLLNDVSYFSNLWKY